MLRTFICTIALCAIAACASVDPNTDGAAYHDNQVSTGSNIPRKGQAAIVDKAVITDALNRGSSGGPARTGGGG